MVEEQQWYYLTLSWEDKGAPFPKGINPKLYVIVWVEFELAYFEAVVQHFNHWVSKVGCDGCKKGTKIRDVNLKASLGKGSGIER